MIQLDAATGRLIIDDFVISPNLSTSDLEGLGEKYKMEKIIKNKQYDTYLIPEIGDGEVALSLYFTNYKLTSVSLELGKKYNFPPFIITSDEKKILQYKLEQIGGANTYHWGKLTLAEDSKSGTISIVINYIIPETNEEKEKNDYLRNHG